MKPPKAHINTRDINRNFAITTTQHGYALNDDYHTTSTSLLKFIFALLLATGLLFATFYLQIIGFWPSICLSMLLLCLLALILGGVNIKFKDVSIGIILLAMLSALLLYAVFFLGQLALGYLWADVYAYTAKLYTLAGGLSPITSGVLIFFIAAPCEEIFWRGFIMRNLTGHLNGYLALLSSSMLYALAHICSLNPLLVLAAFVGGLFWGGLYMWRNNLFLAILSHSIWSVLIFVILPLI